MPYHQQYVCTTVLKCRERAIKQVHDTLPCVQVALSVYLQADGWIALQLQMDLLVGGAVGKLDRVEP